jgi:hypothetical protein
MLCQQCQRREATVHLTIIRWPSGYETTCCCEKCCPERGGVVAASEPVIAKCKPIGTEMTLRTKLKRRYGKHFFVAALNLASRSISASQRHPRSLRGRLVRALVAAELWVLGRLGWVLGLNKELVVFFREARYPSPKLQIYGPKA